MTIIKSNGAVIWNSQRRNTYWSKPHLWALRKVYKKRTCYIFI